MEKKKCTAIVLAAGQGRRMGTKVRKQYVLLEGRPILYYSLHVFDLSPYIDEIVLVVGKGEEEYCRKEIVEKYGIQKVRRIIPGGAERYHSVWKGLSEIEGEGYVFVHDGARPFVDTAMIERAYEAVCVCKACVVGMPVKDTIKLADEEEFVKETPKREFVWLVQTPQVFDAALLKEAYELLSHKTHIQVTADAMVVEQMLQYPVKLVCGSYENIKITTPEDLEVAKVFLSRKPLTQ